jgi:hypothetical protein
VAWQCTAQVAGVSEGSYETTPLSTAQQSTQPEEVAGVWELNAVTCGGTVAQGAPVNLHNRYSALDSVVEEDDYVLSFIGAIDSPKQLAEPSQPAKRKWKKAGQGTITLDSGAEESVWPLSWLPHIPTTPATIKRKFVAANGTCLKHHGEKVVPFRTTGGCDIASVKFQVTDVVKPLVSVKRIIERGNTVSFGATASDCFIQNVTSGKRIHFRPHGGSFVLDVDFLSEDFHGLA